MSVTHLDNRPRTKLVLTNNKEENTKLTIRKNFKLKNNQNQIFARQYKILKK